MVTSILGSLTTTSWNLLLSAASFSMYFWYSSKVVAPISLIFPLERSGFSIWAASFWSCPPAPIIVCNSSIKRMILLVGSVASSRIDFILDSNSPLYFVPATSVPISRRKTFLLMSFSGTFFIIILCTRPSTIAVFPTPASQIKSGLFFVFLKSV